MPFLLEQVRDILGVDAVQLCMSPTAAQRMVTCVTCLSIPGEVTGCASGELAVLACGEGAEECLAAFPWQS
jgi:hypothetical protein